MNIKLHTPKSLKKGSGMSSIKQFLLSILATTVSIVLTFGSAAIVDHNKKAAAKKEMVMMVISDMDNTIELLERVDTALREAKRLQLELAACPELYDSLCVYFPALTSWALIDFPETSEKIFTTSIETFNTIGDVNFVDEVSSFYMSRHQYKEEVLDKMKQDDQAHIHVESLKTLLSVSFPDYVCDNYVFLDDMKATRDRCMQMMNVSEKDMIKFSKKQQRLEYKLDEEDNRRLMEIFNECDSCNQLIERAREKLK